MGAQSLPWFFHFDHIAAGQSTSYALGNGAFDSFGGSSSIVTANSIRRLRLTVDTFNDGDAQLSIPSSDKVVVGFLFRGSGGWLSGGTTGYVVSLETGGTVNLNLFADGNGRLQVRRGSTVLETISTIIGDGPDVYIEFAVHLDNAGSYEVRYDGTEVASDTGVDTTDGGNADNIRFGRATMSGTNGRDFDYAYMYVKEWDDASTPGFYGSLVFHHSAPESDISIEWDPDSGGENFSRLDEATIDDDTSYVETVVDGEVDEYGAEDAPNDLATILAVVRYAVGRAPSGGAPKVEVGLKDGGDESYGSELTLSGAYRTHQSVFTTHPDSSAWTEANYNSSSFLLRSAL